MEISLSLSGGGFRATAYHLGVLFYLDKLVLSNGDKLLDHVNVISGISGGSLTALWFIQGEIKRRSRALIFRELYHILENANVAKDILDTNFNVEDPNCKFTECLSKIYSELFFKDDVFQTILDGIQQCHVHHFSVDATDFSTALPFRFQATKKMPGRFPYGYIGNKKCNIPRDLAGTLKLADIMAASSCFPIAFEPFVIDSSYNERFKNSAFMADQRQIVLMDGGIIDNLGIDPIMRAYEQMKPKKIDLMILSDVTQKSIPQYIAHECCEKKETTERLYNKYKRLVKLIKYICMISFLCLLFSFWVNTLPLLWLGVLLPCLGFLWVNHKYVDPWLKLPPTSYNGLDIPLSKFMKVRLKYLIEFTMNRVKSSYIMVNNIVMSHIRRVSLNSLYTNPFLKNRVILNAQYTLISEGKWKDDMMHKDYLPTLMRPSQKILEVTDEAHSMPTTLWFSEEDIDNKKIDKLIACGEYTICWNLLEYICGLELESNKGKLGPLVNLKKQLLKDWNKFNENPLFMVNRIK